MDRGGRGGKKVDEMRDPVLEAFLDSSCGRSSGVRRRGGGRGRGGRFQRRGGGGGGGRGGGSGGGTDGWTLELVSGHLRQFAKDQRGSRFIQQQIEIAPEAVRSAVFSELLGCAAELCEDVFGNYGAQRFFGRCVTDRRKAAKSAICTGFRRVWEDR